MPGLCETEGVMIFLVPAAARSAALIYLFLCSLSDLRTRCIRPFYACVVSTAALPLSLLSGNYPPSEILLILAGGLFLFLISFVSKSAIGAGDCYVIAACSFLLGFSCEFLCLTAGLLICAGWSLWLLARKKAKRNDALPFLPFLTAGHLTVFTAELLSIL